MNSWHTFWEIFWEIAIWVPIVILWITALFDLVGHPAISGGKKAAWAVLIVFVPIVGALIYFGLRPKRESPTGPSEDEKRATVVEALDRAARLHDAGKLSDQEYESVKRQLVGDQPSTAATS